MLPSKDLSSGSSGAGTSLHELPQLCRNLGHYFVGTGGDYYKAAECPFVEGATMVVEPEHAWLLVLSIVYLPGLIVSSGLLVLTRASARP